MGLTPLPTCAQDPDAHSCEHDRMEPMWAINPVEETGNPGPYVFCCITFRADELDSDLTDPDAWIEEMEASIAWYRDAKAIARLPDGTLNDCERRHLACYEYDFAKLKGIASARSALRATPRER